MIKKSMLAKLLANENITVEAGNFKTASFDLKHRVLRLPNWEVGNDAVDMLTGHEVGHALFTPGEEYIAAAKSGKFSPSLLNIIEDARIERLIQSKYPGLIKNFKVGYKEIFDLGVFGIKDTDVPKLGFIDRLNIKAKLRDMMNVPFASDEVDLFNRALRTETFDDVLELCQDIHDFLVAKKQNAETDADDLFFGDPGESEQNDPKGCEGMEGEGSPSEGADDGDDGDDAAGGSRSSDDDGEEGDDGENKAGKGAGGNEEINYGDPWDDAKSDLHNIDGCPKILNTAPFFNGPDWDAISSRIVNIDEVMNTRNVHQYDYDANEYAAFRKDKKRVVNGLVKEFEMRKAAFRTLRARTSPRGTLDVNKLHKYKYDDLLFKTSTQLADGKNHAMIMVVDLSGSMWGSIEAVYEQVYILATFCKRVGVPFIVYGFTDCVKGGKESTAQYRINMSSTKLVEIIRSDLPKAKWEECLRQVWAISTNFERYHSYSFEAMGSTPLDQSLMMIDTIADKFKVATRAEKMTIITLTDGSSNGVDVHSPDAMTYRERTLVSYGSRDADPEDRGTVTLRLNGRDLVLPTVRGYVEGVLTSHLMKHFQNRGYSTISFNIVSSASEIRNYLRQRECYDFPEYKHGVGITGKELFGYDVTFFLASCRNNEVSVSDIAAPEKVTVNNLKKVLMTSANSKKANQAIAKTFATVIS